MINSPFIFAVESSLGRKPVNNAIAIAIRKVGSTNRVKRRVSSSFDNGGKERFGKGTYLPCRHRAYGNGYSIVTGGNAV